MVASKPIFRDSDGWEKSGDIMPGEKAPKKERAEAGTPADDGRALRRASAAVRRLTHCADMKYFVTLTLDKDKVNRYDAGQIIKKLSTWADNQVRRKGLCYILVPERHKDGAIHFHGFINGALPVVDSGTISRKGHKKPQKPRSERQRAQWLSEGGQVVYNLPAWPLGFSTAIELYGDRDRAISYTVKYLVKDMETGGKVGGRWYYHGGKFAEPQVMYTDVFTQDIVSESDNSYYVFDVPEAGLVMAMKRGRLDGSGKLC